MMRKKLKNLWLLIMSGENWNRLGRIKRRIRGRASFQERRKENKIPNGIRFPLNGSPVQQIDLKNKTLDDVFKYSSENKINFVNIFSKESATRLSIWHEAGFNKYNYLVLYTPPDRKSIAVEPMTSNINAFNSKEGLIIIEPGESWSASYGFSLKE